METVKTTENYTIYKKRSGRFAVKGTNRKYINGEEKAKILAEAGLITLSKAAEKPAEEAPAEEVAAEETAEASAEGEEAQAE